MDPEKCLLDAEQLVSDGDYEGAEELIESYRIWRANGGFQPRNMPHYAYFWGDAFASHLLDKIEDAARD
jgi:hypothetical protein